MRAINHLEGNPVVRVTPVQPHCFAFGGFELQMIGAMQAAGDAGVDISPLDMWSRNDDFNIAHFWGFEVTHFHTAKWANAANKKLVMTALLTNQSIIHTLRNFAAHLVGSSRIKFDMLPWLSAIAVVNSEQEKYAVNVLGVSKEKVHVIPNIVAEIFFNPPLTASGFNVGFNDYILCTGNVCSRKNQLMLVKACRKLGVPLLIIGDVLIGENAYGEAVAKAMHGDPKMYWIQGLEPGSDALASAYANCVAFALPSYAEAQPISALEAAAAGKPILLAKRPYAKQEFFANSALVAPDSQQDLIKGLKQVLNSPTSYSVPREVLERCRRENVGEAYRRLYNAVL